MSVRFICGWLICIAMTAGACSEQAEKQTQESEPVEQESDIAKLTAAIENDPGDAEAYYQRARFHYNNANYADATYDMAAAMKIDSVNEEYHLLLADIYLESYQSELALATMDRTVSLFPESVETLLKAAEMQIILRRYTMASQSLRSVLEQEPQNIRALQLLGVMLKEQGDMDQAIQSFQTVVELDGDNYEAWTMLGNLLDIKGDPMALRCFDNAIAIDSTYAQGWHSKAFYLQNRGQMDEAIDIYLKIHRLDSSYVDAYLNAGILYLEKGDLESAENEFRTFQDIDPRNPMAPFYLGVLRETEEKYREALGFYNQAAALSPRTIRFAEAAERMKIMLGQQ